MTSVRMMYLLSTRQEWGVWLRDSYVLYRYFTTLPVNLTTVCSLRNQWKEGEDGA